MEGEPILKKTLTTVAVMVGAWVAFVGTVSLIAVLVTSHVVGASPESTEPTGDRIDPSTSPSAPGHMGRSKGDGPRVTPQNVTPTHQRPATPRPHDTI